VDRQARSDSRQLIWLFDSAKHSDNSLENKPNYKSAGNKNTSSRAGYNRLALALLLFWYAVESDFKKIHCRNRIDHMYTFDLRNALVPFSLLDVRHRFKEMRSGESMVVLWGDAGAAEDLLRILPDASFDIVSQAEIPGSPSGFRMELTKK